MKMVENGKGCIFLGETFSKALSRRHPVTAVLCSSRVPFGYDEKRRGVVDDRLLLAIDNIG